MPGPDLTSGSDPLSGTLTEAEARIAALEKSGTFAPGMVGWTVGSVAPVGWLIADGSTYDVDRYAALYAVLGSGTLPDLRDRMPMGAGNLYALLAVGGAAAVTLTAAQSGVPAHTHTATATSTVAGSWGRRDATSTWDLANAGGGRPDSISTPAVTTTVTVNANSGASAAASHENLPPYVALTPLIHI